MALADQYDPKEPWHLDRRVPIALIVTIIVQTAALGWWAATLTGRVDVLERDLERQRVVDVELRADVNQIDRLSIAQTKKMENILAIVERIDRRLDRLEDGVFSNGP